MDLIRSAASLLHEVVMLNKVKFFVFSDKTLGYQEIKWFKRKVLLSGATVGLAAVGGVLLLNYAFGDPLGMSRSSNLATENAALRNQLSELTKKTERIKADLAQLAGRTNDLRLMVALPKVDDATRNASSGGALFGSEFSFLSRSVNATLRNADDLLSQMEREVQIQKQSYIEISKQYEANKVLFKHLPAVKPCDGPYSLNGFGMRIHPVLGVWRMHEGLDIMNEIGTPVYAPGDATVRFAGVTASGYGRVIELDHGYGYTTLFAHLSEVSAREGRKVKRGELIGRVGRSGLVSGPHLHYEVRLHGRKMNPVDYFFDDVDAARYRTELASAK
jgi:murein DD-endopeptidase MepM/ murein hydrolase activator NlpD